jgi:hypothetical protein
VNDTISTSVIKLCSRVARGSARKTPIPMSAKTFEISAPKAKVAADVASPSVPSNHGKSAFNNLKLQQYEWLAAHPKAIVFLVLGIHDHCGRYSEMALQLAAAGFSVYSFDMMGHGRLVVEIAKIVAIDPLAESGPKALAARYRTWTTLSLICTRLFAIR